MLDKKIYFDCVSSTQPSPEVLKTYASLLDKYYVNANALYDEGVEIYNLQEKARANIAELLGVKTGEVIFTSGATEGNNAAIKGVAWAAANKKHLITTIYEHSSVYSAFKQLEEHGFSVTYLKPNEKGVITLDEVKKALRDDTALVSIRHVNNEIGTINDIDTIGEYIKKHSNAYFHTDITQSIGKIPVDLKNVDLATFSAHKIHGLKGSGILVKKLNVKMDSLISGGQQEFGLRGGTSNAPADIVLAKTIRLALENMPKHEEVCKELHDYFISRLSEIKGTKINSPDGGLSCLINISTPIKSEVLMNALNLKGIMVSSKSTCGTRSHAPSRVLESIGVDSNYAIRISFDTDNVKEDVDYFIECLKEIIAHYE